VVYAGKRADGKGGNVSTEYKTIGSVTLLYDSDEMRKAIKELSLRMDAFIEDGGKYRLTIEKVEEAE